MGNENILINAIIGRLNEQIREENKRKCEQNLHIDQKPLHGGDMFFRLAFLPESELQIIAKAAGL